MTSWIVFLVLGKKLRISRLDYVLDDFLEDYKWCRRRVSARDRIEINRIRENPLELESSYLFKKIRPYVLPFYER